MERTNAERDRLSGEAHEVARWRAWGPYLADRAWASVREDYSANSDPWSYFPHDLARKKPFRWGDDGIGGFCGRYQIFSWSLALWNQRDPILKERYFGLIPTEGNHGEDVKECYFYVDALPSHAYQRMIYKYPQAEYPYARLIEENRKRGLNDPEFELIDTGVFDESRYFDVEIEIAKETPDSIVFRVTAHNRGPDRAPLHLIPQIWFPNTWSWRGAANPRKPVIRADGRNLVADDTNAEPLTGLLHDTRLGPHVLELPAGAELLFTDNEEGAKDAFHRRIINGERLTATSGTKAGAWMRFDVEAGESAQIEMRLRPQSTEARGPRPEDVFAKRKQEADDFYESIHPPKATEEERRIQRQAFAGMLWNKQIYLYDVDVWLDGDNPRNPPPRERENGRNHRWRHLNSMRIMSMPDKWEYPWFAAWDLAFQAVVFALIDAHFAKEQLWLLLFEQFQHPNGQIPAYEWEFSDLNPPVQAWAVWRVYNMDRIRSGKADRDFLERCFHTLLLKFTWSVNKVDREGNNVFEGGFLGLDNITVFDRSEQLPGGARLEQSDATGWMGMFCLVMMRIALELSKTNDAYEGLATKFFEHYVYIGAAMKMMRGDVTLWDEQDGFFYDLLRFPDGGALPFRVRSMVGLIPLYAIERLEETWIEPFDVFRENLEWFIKHRRDIVERCVTTVRSNGNITHVLAVVDEVQLEHLLAYVVDTREFLSPYGIRSLSKAHQATPFTFGNASVGYEPAESVGKLKGGNSNWRGPVWFPTSFLIIESLRKLEKAFGGTIRVALHDTRAPQHDPDATLTDTRADEGLGAGSSRRRGMTIPGTVSLPPEIVSLSGLARDIANRMIAIFLPDAEGYRPLYGPHGTRKAELFAHDPHWRDLVLFHEYFHGDTGEGLGASHQTGWTALVANLIDEWR